MYPKKGSTIKNLFLIIMNPSQLLLPWINKEERNRGNVIAYIYSLFIV